MHDIVIENRDEEFVQFVITQVRQREQTEEAFYASLDDDPDVDPVTGEVLD